MTAYDQQWQEEIRALIWFVRTWAAHKEENRMGWLQALHTVVCGTKIEQASGSLPFYAFPERVVESDCRANRRAASATGGTES